MATELQKSSHHNPANLLAKSLTVFGNALHNSISMSCLRAAVATLSILLSHMTKTPGKRKATVLASVWLLGQTTVLEELEPS